MGRPKLEPGAARGNRVQFRLTDAERAEVDAAALRVGQDLSDWVRAVVLDAARRPAKKPGKRAASG